MKENESFDHTLFMKMVCIVAAIALLCVVVFVIIGAVNGSVGDGSMDSNGYESYTFAPDTTDAPKDTTAAPADTTSAPISTDPVTTEAPSSTAEPTSTTAESGDISSLPSSNAILPESADAGQEYIDSIVFFGDSTTYGMIAYKVLSEKENTKQVWTPVNGTLTLDQAVKKKIKYPETGEEITPAEAAAAKLPKYLVITLGVNGVSFMNEEQFITEYTKLVQSIQKASPTTKIMLQSIFPVASTYEKLNSINNENISRANTWVLKVAENCGVKYLDTASVLRESDGWLTPSFHNGDGMHFNETGYKVVLDYIRTHAYID